MKLTGLYREQLMEEYKNPSNKGSLANPSVAVSKNNPFCGDKINLQLKVNEGMIEDIMFDGPACAVSVASSSLVTNWAKGKSVSEVAKLRKEEVLDMLGVELTTSRVKCAVLVLEALKEAVKKYE